MLNRGFVFLVLFLFTGLCITAQDGAVLNGSARMFVRELRQAESGHNLMKKLVSDYDLISINGEHCIGVLVLADEQQLDRAGMALMGVRNDTRLGTLYSMRVPVSRFNDFIALAGIRYIEVGEPVSPDLHRAVPSARVDSVHGGLGGLHQSYTGKGVVVAIIDWGFDYTHPVFYDTTMTDLRIVRAWDQNKLSGPAPAGYSFGTEYVGQQQLLSAGCDTFYVFGHTSHGTHVAGIAAGTGAGTVHKGVAFEADIIMISLRRDAPSLIDAFSYITNYAASVGKPYVVNMSFGSHLGPHDGSFLKNLAIDSLHGPGRIFVGSAGNNGGSNSRFHLDKDFSFTPGDTLKTVVGFANVADMFGQTLSMWGSANSDFSVALRLVNSTNQFIYETPFYNSLHEPLLIDTILVGNDTLILRIESTARHYLNDKPNIRLEVKRTGSAKVVLLATSTNTHLHIWNNVRMNNRYTNWGVPLSATYPDALVGNQDFGLGEPAGVGKNVITVASYVAERLHNNNWILGNLSSFSSKGPTVDYRAKPDIASTGDQVISSVSSFDITQTQFETTVGFNGVTYGFVAFSGTSMSSPMVTGIVAMMLEANPNMSALQAKEILKQTARLDNHTGPIDSAGDLRWGWGKANALAAVKAAEALTSVLEAKFNNDIFTLYPNPAGDVINIAFDNHEPVNGVAEIFSLDGKLMKRVENLNQPLNRIDVSNLPQGVYVITFRSERAIGVRKFMKE